MKTIHLFVHADRLSPRFQEKPLVNPLGGGCISRQPIAHLLNAPNIIGNIPSTAGKRTMPRIYDLSGRPALAAATSHFKGG
jgi:hypothetical protein